MTSKACSWKERGLPLKNAESALEAKYGLIRAYFYLIA